jgi:hypothetical protein
MTGTGQDDEKSAAEDDIEPLDDVIRLALMGDLAEPERAESEGQPPEETLPDAIGGTLMGDTAQEEAPLGILGALVEAIADAGQAPEKPAAEEEDAPQTEPLGDVLGSTQVREPGKQPNVLEDLIGGLGLSAEPQAEQHAAPAERAAAPLEHETGASSEVAPLGDVLGSVQIAEGQPEQAEEPEHSADIDQPPSLPDDQFESRSLSAKPPQEQSDVIGSGDLPDSEQAASSDVQGLRDMTESAEVSAQEPEQAAQEELVASSELQPLGEIIGSMEPPEPGEAAADGERAPGSEVEPLHDIIGSIQLPEHELGQAGEPDVGPPVAAEEQAASSESQPLGDSIGSQQLPGQAPKQVAAEEDLATGSESQPLGDTIGSMEVPDRAPEQAAEGELAASSDIQGLGGGIGSRDLPNQESGQTGEPEAEVPVAEEGLAASSELQPFGDVISAVGIEGFDAPAPNADVKKKAPEHGGGPFVERLRGETPQEAAAEPTVEPGPAKEELPHRGKRFVEGFSGTDEEAAPPEPAPEVATPEQGGGGGFVDSFLGASGEPPEADETEPQAEPDDQTYQTYGWDQVDPEDVPDIPIIDYDNPDRPAPTLVER